MWPVSVSAGHNNLFSVETLHIRQAVPSSERQAADWRPGRLVKGLILFFLSPFFHSLILLVQAFIVSASWRRATTRDARPLLSTVIPPTHQPASSFFPSRWLWIWQLQALSTPPPSSSLACIYIKSHHRLITCPVQAGGGRGWLYGGAGACLSGRNERSELVKWAWWWSGEHAL